MGVRFFPGIQPQTKQIAVYSTPLNAGVTYTSPAYDLQGWPAISFAAYTDQAGTASANNTNVKISYRIVRVTS